MVAKRSSACSNSGRQMSEAYAKTQRSLWPPHSRITVSSMCSGLRETLTPGPASCLAEFSTAALYNALSFCDGSRAMFSRDDEGQQGRVWVIVLGLIAVVLTLVVGIGLYRLNGGEPPVPPTGPETAVAAAS